METLASARQRGQGYDVALESYYLRCRTRNLSPDTIEICRLVLNRFRDFLSELEVYEPALTTPHHIRQFLDHLGKTQRKPGTILRWYGVIRSFFHYMHIEETVDANPALNIEKPKVPRILINPLSAEQIPLLLATANTKTFAGFRNWTIMVLLLDTGLRQKELITLKLSKIDWKRSSLTVMGKGSKERAVPFGANTKQAMLDYYAKRGDLQGQDLFFVDQFGLGIKKRWLHRIVARAGEKAGIQGIRVSPHTLRHTFATQYIMNGGDAFSLQQILGHETLEMVKIYVKLANRDISIQHQKFSPMDRLGPLPNQRRKIILR